MVLLNSPFAYFSKPLLSAPSLFSVSRLRLLGLGICFLRPCCYYRAVLLPPPCLHVSSLFPLSVTVYWCKTTVVLKPSYLQAALHPLSCQGAGRIGTFTSLNFHRKTGWPTPTDKRVRGEWRPALTGCRKRISLATILEVLRDIL